MRINNLQEVISKLNRHHKEYLESKDIKVTRNSFQCTLTTHEDENASAKFRTDEEGKVHCFGCGSNYDILDSYAALEGTPAPSEPGWIENSLIPLARKFSVDLSFKTPTVEEEFIYTGYRINQDVVNFIKESSLTKEVKKFAKDRSIDIKTLNNLDIGTIPSFKDLIAYLKDHKWTNEQIKEYNIERQDIFSPLNLIIPIRDKNRNVVGFNSRNTQFTPTNNKNDKFINSPNSEIFRKSESLFGIDTLTQMVKRGKTSTAYIVEGIFDWLALYNNGIKNVVALNGSAASHIHFSLLRSIGISEVVLTLDNDDAGHKATQSIINNDKYWEGLKVKVHPLEKGEDPDSFITLLGIDKFKETPTLSSYAWTLERLIEEGRPHNYIIEIMCQSLANESDPIIAYTERKRLSEVVNIPEEIIKEKVEQIQENAEQELKEKTQELALSAAKQLTDNPLKASQISHDLSRQIEELQSSNNEDNFSSIEVLNALNNQEQRENEKEGGLDGFYMPNKPILQNVLYGPWRHNAIMLVGGKPNVGKTNLMTDLALEVVRNNDGIILDNYGKTTEETIVLYHTIDDSRAKIINRMATNIAADYFNYCTFNMIANPNLYHNIANSKTESEKFIQARAKGYNQLRELINNERLFIKDIKHGTNLDYIHSWLTYIRRKFPADKYAVLYILDNLSKVDTKENTRDQAEARKISEGMKKLINIFDVSAICTVEYTKLGNGVVPTDNDFRDTNQLRYDADVLAHCINDLTENPETPKFWRSESRFDLSLAKDQQDTNLPKWPVTELLVTKNKITEFRDTRIYSDMVPPQAKLREIARIELDSRIDENLLSKYKTSEKEEKE